VLTAWWYGFWVGVAVTAVLVYKSRSWPLLSEEVPSISYKEPDETAQEVIDEIESLPVMRRRSSHPRWMREVKDIIESTDD